MTIYNFGSINLDHVYQVDHFVRPGETMASKSYQCLLGGKGANQSAALAKAGAEVMHVGAVHSVDKLILKQLQEVGVNTDLVEQLDMPTGHAIIQISKSAENAIILYPGANHCLTHAQIDAVLESASDGDWVLLQNETNLGDYIVTQAKNKALKVAYNPAPMDVTLTQPLLAHIDLLIVNEVEAMDLVSAASVDEAAELLPERYPSLAVMMTLGSEGVRYFEDGTDISVSAFKVEAKDTTAAGDTFIGFTMAALFEGLPVEEAIKRGCAASAICVTRIGALAAIPELGEVTDFMSRQS